jgi:hypothetical protein
MGLGWDWDGIGMGLGWDWDGRKSLSIYINIYFAALVFRLLAELL